MKKVISFSFILLTLTLFGCQKNETSNGTETLQYNNDSTMTKTNDTETKKVSFDQTRPVQKGDTVAIITTNKGVIKARIFVEDGKEIAKNFVELAKQGFYDGIIFHRVIPNFMIQGGDPMGSGFGGYSYKGEGTKIDDYFIPGSSNIRGSLSMANSGPNTNGSQFFINQKDNTFLDYDKEPLSSRHAVFGQVYEGMDVVDLIANVSRDQADKPVSQVVMEKVEIQVIE